MYTDTFSKTAKQAAIRYSHLMLEGGKVRFVHNTDGTTEEKGKTLSYKFKIVGRKSTYRVKLVDTAEGYKWGIERINN